MKTPQVTLLQYVRRVQLLRRNKPLRRFLSYSTCCTYTVLMQLLPLKSYK